MADGTAMTMASLTPLEAKTPDISRMLALLANQQRLRILWRLATSGGELSIAALAPGLDMSQSALSQHLAKLRHGGIVAARRDGHRCLYRITDRKAARLALGLGDIVAN